jgi:hypothetical protein
MAEKWFVHDQWEMQHPDTQNVQNLSGKTTVGEPNSSLPKPILTESPFSVVHQPAAFVALGVSMCLLNLSFSSPVKNPICCRKAIHESLHRTTNVGT